MTRKTFWLTAAVVSIFLSGVLATVGLFCTIMAMR